MLIKEDLKISVIIPAYNIAPYIERCLKSVFNQTYSNLEIIVVNDGSTDETGEILDDLCTKEKRLTVIHKKNDGVTLARLTGLKVCTGDYVGFVDGDDVIEKDMYEFLVKNAIKYSADISHCGYVMDFPDGHCDYYYNKGNKVIQSTEQGLEDLLSGQFVEPGLWNKIYKKNIINSMIEENNVDYSIKNLEDLLINYHLFKYSKKSIYEDQCKYHYTLRKNSATVKPSKNKFEDPIKVFNILLDETKNDPKLYEIVYHRYIYCLIGCITQKNYKDVSKSSRRKLKKELDTELFQKLSLKLQIMSYLNVYFVNIYRIIRKIYDLITGVDKKYEVR